MSARRPLREVLRDGVDEPRLNEIWDRVQARRSTRRLARRVLVPALGAGCALVLAWASTRAPRDAHDVIAAPQAALRLASGEVLSPASAISVDAQAPARVVALSDGTRITVAAGGRLVPRASTSRRLELAVEHGQARFEVQPQHGRAFVVSAGDLQVEVVGTVFSVEHGPSDSAVVVEHGRVRVRTPDAAGVHMLGAGESLRWPQAPALAQPPDAVPVAAPVIAPEQAAAPPDLPRTTASKATAPASASAAAHAAAASGDYARAYALLGRSGYERAVRTEREIDALLELADVARGAGKPKQAALALARILELYPQGDRSALAALTLGRLQLDVLAQPAAAARTLRIALAAGLPIALQEDALARLVDASSRAGQQADAEHAAAQYRGRFPNGRWRTSVEQWVKAR